MLCTSMCTVTSPFSVNTEVPTMCQSLCVCVCTHVSENIGQNIIPGFVSQLTRELKVKKMLLLQLGSSNHKSPLGILVWGEGRTTP